MGNKNYSALQIKAKELGIKNWHVKKDTTLTEEIENRKDDIVEKVGNKPATVPQVSYGQLLDILDEYAMNNLANAFEALDNISRTYYKGIIPVFDKMVQGYPGLNEETDLDFLYEVLNRGTDKTITRNLFNDFISSVVHIYNGKGWYLNMRTNKLHAPSKPTFKLDWHINLWTKQAKDKSSVYRILAILAAPESKEE
jgi:hypothetical protein